MQCCRRSALLRHWRHPAGKILVPQTVSNLTFGGPKKNRLFITATQSLYSIYTATNGVQYP